MSLINGLYEVAMLPDRISFHAMRPNWEAERLACMSQRITPGMTVFDIGAESGDFTALYRSWTGPTGTIVAVEPQPRYWPSIRQTWELNFGFGVPPRNVVGFASDKTVVPERGPSWTAHDEALTHLGAHGWPKCSDGTVVPDFGFKHLCQQSTECPQWRLDDLAAHLGLRPDAIVIDIEGAEWHAIQGCEGLIQPDGCRPLLYVSVHEATMFDWYGHFTGEIIKHLRFHGYREELLGWNGEDYWFFYPEEAE